MGEFGMQDFPRGVSETDCHGATPYSLLTRQAGVDDDTEKDVEFSPQFCDK